jgi:hypothetical protein
MYISIERGSIRMNNCVLKKAKKIKIVLLIYQMHYNCVLKLNNYFMKKISTIFLSLLLILSISSCMKSPVASITADRVNSSIIDPITITSTSENANAYSWKIYDGAATSGTVSTHIIKISGGEDCDNKITFKVDKPGQYTLMFYAYNRSKGCTSTEGSSKSDSKTYNFIVN